MYSAFYRFSVKPFEITPDPEFLYLTPGYHTALDTTVRSIRDHSPFASITGEAGTGKTTLIYSILMRLDEKVKTAFIFNPLMTFPELIGKILQDLDLAEVGTNQEALRKQLGEYFIKRLAADETLVIFIDEAQHLAKEVMEALGKLQEWTPEISNRMRIIFVGQPEFDDKLNSWNMRQLSQKIGTKCKIKPLTDEESRGYIDHRLRVAGSNSSLVFTPDALSTIVHHAKGIPRIINILCDNALLAGYGLSKSRVDADIVRQVIREMEGPIPQGPTASTVVRPRKGLQREPLRNLFALKRIPLVILCLLCVAGGLFLIQEPRKEKPANTWTIESIRKPRIDTETASPGSLPPETKQERRDAPPAPDPLESKSQGPLQTISPPPDLPSSKPEAVVSTEVIVVKEGQSISSLAQKYYNMVNPTLIDFILDFNPEITNADHIQIEQKMRIPRITEEGLIKKSPNHAFKIWAGTFWGPESVEPYRKEPELKGKRIEILPRKVSPKDTWYRVVIGDFDREEDALKVIGVLKQKKLLPIF